VLKQTGDLSAPCFSGFLAETRSSSSVTATLRDFVLGGFDGKLWCVDSNDHRVT
jgi:hypothetical protein